ncbi:MAG: FAD-dependent oxidoreductase [Actinomycetota bacterium]|nr:FAD-dependent oxidoreductase [Actinomycetota bacterium]
MPNLKLIKKEEIIKGIFSFHFNNIDSLKWQAGQYLQLIIPHENADNRGVKRFFTISSAPFEKRITITTRIETKKSSTFKKILSELKAGDIIECSQPKGKFLVEDLSRKILFIAGGIGITPVRSILMDLQYKEKSFQADLLYANRDNNIAFKNELEEIGNSKNNFRIYYFIAPESICEEELDKIYNDYNDKIIYLSGPINMIKAIEEIFYKKGVSKENIRTDYFPGYD